MNALSFPRMLAVLALASVFCFCVPSLSQATDNDGAGDCARILEDWGDAPEAVDAYPGVPGRFPTCAVITAPGDLDLECLPPVGPPPGPTGFVRHDTLIEGEGFWLGCDDLFDIGIDSEADGNFNVGGGPFGACNPAGPDCIEATPIGDFGQDECFGDDDSGLVILPDFQPCEFADVMIRTSNCWVDRDVFVNVLVDWNQDGDWNDNVECPNGCAEEWAVQNFVMPIPVGCFDFVTPLFQVGPNPGPAWMRISISENPAPDDFPWAGSANLPLQGMQGGETEDYLVMIGEGGGCNLQYEDLGDAPEVIQAYPSGIIGNFPTCRFFGGVGTQEIDPDCPGSPVGTPPGLTGHVEHVQPFGAVDGFWFGCVAGGGAGPFVDTEPDGKVNVIPVVGAPSDCDLLTPTDCVEPAFAGFAYGQDECAFDGVDAGLTAPPLFERCDIEQVTFDVFNCAPIPALVVLNVLIDWNEDGDWNDVLECEQRAACAPEWAVQNLPFILPPGCSNITTPPIQVGPNEGFGWMRATLTREPVPDDFPWNGSVGTANGFFLGGETEDYPIEIEPSAVGVEINGSSQSGLWLAPIAPNPARTRAQVSFSLTRSGPVNLVVYDVAGRRVRSLVDAERGAGTHTETWDLRDEQGQAVAPGLYLMRLEAEGEILTSRLTRIR